MGDENDDVESEDANSVHAFKNRSKSLGRLPQQRMTKQLLLEGTGGDFLKINDLVNNDPLNT